MGEQHQLEQCRPRVAHIDRLCDKVEGHRFHNHLSFEKAQTTAETSESDLRRVHAEGKEADKQLRSELDAMSTLPSAGHDQLTAQVTALKDELSALKSELASLPALAAGSGPAWPPGLDNARLLALEQKAQEQEARLAELTRGLSEVAATARAAGQTAQAAGETA